ncbi:Transmembrane BAX inhibitor motif-containing protein 4 [Dirofilaria immitis]|nr:Transmembrane BAX inhibitor motif-containing protein 4 [Dirofilaria immitis]
MWGKMATVPLLLEEDIELGLPPSYEEAASEKRTSQNHSMQHHPWFFDFNSNKATANLAPVIFATDFAESFRHTICAAAYYSHSLYDIIRNSGNSSFLAGTTFPTLWILFISIIGSFVLLFAMFTYARSVPLNYILLISWTVMQSITVGAVVSFFDVKVVVEAVGLTALTITGLFIYTLQSKRDFQSHWAALFSVSMVFLAASFIHLFIQSALFHFLIATFGAILFSIYLVFDIDRIMHHTSPEDYIEACVSLYLDIINLFLRILEILNEANRN